MEKYSLEHIYTLIAKANNVDDVILMLEKLADSMFDVRTKIGEHDSIPVRQALGKVLSDAVDEIKRKRNTSDDRPDKGSYQ